MAKILLVEDDAQIVEFISTWLKAEGHTIVVAADGNEGLKHMMGPDYDVILLDWDLPFMPGDTLLKKFRADKRVTPVIMLTGKSDIDHKEAGLDSGADDYLPKPFSLKELSARIRAQFRRRPPSHP